MPFVAMGGARTMEAESTLAVDDRDAGLLSEWRICHHHVKPFTRVRDQAVSDRDRAFVATNAGVTT